VAIDDDIDELAERARNDLDDLFNFGAHIHLIWKQFVVWAHQGNKFKSKNIYTEKEVSEAELIELYRRYRTDYLHSLSFQHLVALFEAFLFDLLRLLHADDPRHLNKKKQLEVGVALSAPDRHALVLLIADRELNELKYKRPSEWFEYLNGIVDLGCPTADEINLLSEIKASRDLLVHNMGLVNSIYLDKAAASARYKIGEKVVIDTPRFNEAWKLVKKVVDDISAAAKARLSKSNTPSG
jgi:hypothetical protein